MAPDHPRNPPVPPGFPTPNDPGGPTVPPEISPPPGVPETPPGLPTEIPMPPDNP